MVASRTIAIGLVVARERLANPWQDYRWRPTGVLLELPSGPAGWRELRRDHDAVHYLAAPLPLELHHKETAAYGINLDSGAPSIYVVLRETTRGDPSLDVHLVTFSPYEVQAYGESGFDIVDRVPMPERLIAVLQDFVDEHHVEEPFVKRQRQKHHVEDEHKFGQEPLLVVRDRMAARRKGARDG